MAGAGFASFAIAPHIIMTPQEKPSPQTTEESEWEKDPSKGWVPVSNRKIRVGLVGYGASKFAAAFGFQNHPNVEVVAVSDLFPDRCAELAKVTKCKKTYPSLEELVKDNKIEAVFVATDAPGHVRHCIEVLKHGKHVACAVPAVFGSLEDADLLFEAVKKSGLKYMMFETSCFRADNYAMRQIYNAGGFGKLVYSEGEYFHGPSLSPAPAPTPAKTKTTVPSSYNGWRDGVIPQWYPTHSNAYYVGVTNGSFTEVSCLGMESLREINKGGKNQYNNPFATEIALLRTSEGGMARMGVSWDTPGFGGEMGRIRGQKGSYYGKYQGLEKDLPGLVRPPLPPGVPAGGHGGSHGPLMNEFVLSLLQDRNPLVDIAMSLNMTVAGVVAHQSAMNDGEWMKIPQYRL
ncbi:MAG TPA: gfo/Idh/MocA family oxidoreductase [Bacteroidales bacterium]|nr:gfo/Idh/MocA family oxidoreductase [Bacteroidales bacterium]